MTKKITKILFILLLFLAFSITYVHASDININLPGANNNEVSTNTQNNNTDENIESVINGVNNVDQNVVDNTNEPDENEDDITDAMSPTDTQTLQPSTVTSTPESGLSVTNIINILLITVGVILILLAIAIIIRLK